MSESGPRRFLDVAVNIAILISAACLVALVFVRLRTPHAMTQTQPPLSLGQHLAVHGLQPANHGSLVFVLQIGCRYCEKSMPFYRSLGPAAVNHGEKLVYVLPSTSASSRKYLSQNGLADGDVLQATLDEARVSGTPTVILLDDSDSVKGVWVGELDKDGQQQVQAAVANLSHR